MALKNRVSGPFSYFSALVFLFSGGGCFLYIFLFSYDFFLFRAGGPKPIFCSWPTGSQVKTQEALFMTSILCSNITIFGMASPGTIDNHIISQLHDIEKERHLIERLIAGKVVTAPGWPFFIRARLGGRT